MNIIEMNISKNTERNLKALHAGIYTLKHRHLSEEEKKKIKSCLEGNFQELDKEKISFKLQNMIIDIAEQKEDYLEISKYYKLNIV